MPDRMVYRCAVHLIDYNDGIVRSFAFAISSWDSTLAAQATVCYVKCNFLLLNIVKTGPMFTFQMIYCISELV